MKRVPLVLTSLTLILSTMAQAAPAPFDLERRGDKICKVGFNYPQPVCYTSASAAAGVRESIDLVPLVKAAYTYAPDGNITKIESMQQMQDVGGALFIKKADRDIIRTYYRELSVRNIGIDLENVEKSSNENRFHFVASVRWKGAWFMEGTIQVEGYISVPSDLTSNTNDTLAALNQVLARWYTLSSYNDSSTELRMEPARLLETAARYVHFTRVYGIGTNVDGHTKHLLQNVVGPAVAGEVIFIPAAKGIAGMLNQMIDKLFGKP